MDYFDNYVKEYRRFDKSTDYKYYHSYRVMHNMEIIGKSLNLTKEDIELAKTIGLLHDIGKIKKDDKKYNNDHDHGDYGADLLLKQGLMKKFNITKEDSQIVYKAIKNHSKFSIEKGLNERELLFCKMIRDADKIDILNALGDSSIKDKLLQDNSKVNEKIKTIIRNKKVVDKKYIINKNDNLAAVFSLIYDLNFAISYKIIYQERYLDKIYQRIINKENFKEILDETSNYLKERIDINDR